MNSAFIFSVAPFSQDFCLLIRIVQRHTPARLKSTCRNHSARRGRETITGPLYLSAGGSDRPRIFIPPERERHLHSSRLIRRPVCTVRERCDEPSTNRLIILALPLTIVNVKRLRFPRARARSRGNRSIWREKSRILARNSSRRGKKEGKKIANPKYRRLEIPTSRNLRETRAKNIPHRLKAARLISRKTA